MSPRGNTADRSRKRPVQTKLSLSPERRRLVEIMQKIGFGQIQGLQVRSGQPVFAPAPRVVRKIKMGGQNAARSEIARRDFELKKEVRELLGHMSHLRDGIVARIEVKHGLPFSIDIEQDAGC